MGYRPALVQGSAVVTITMAETAFLTRVMVVNPLTAEAILGIDFLKENRGNVLVGKEILDFPTMACLHP